MEFSQRTFKDALGAYPTGVTIVTALGSGGEDVGITANSFTSLSLDPPLVLWCLDRAAYSWRTFDTCRHFAINILSDRQADLSRQFAVAGASKWTGVAFERGHGGCAVLLGCVASLECERHAAFDGGDHEILVGRVLRIRQNGGEKPLVYHGGKYRDLGAERR